MAQYTYFPERGDFVHLNFSPSARREMASRHYALVLSTASFARKTGFAVVCPITSNSDPWPFDVLVPRGILPEKAGRSIDSVVLTDQVKSIDFREREFEFVARATVEILDEVLGKVRAILDSNDPIAEFSG